MEISSPNNKISHLEKRPISGKVDRTVMPLQEPNSDNPTHERTMAPWSNLSILGKVFDFMTDPKDLVACACVCKNWGAEVASSDHLFKASWTREISDQGLWRWSRAAGGYRDQLRANSVVRKGKILN